MSLEGKNLEDGSILRRSYQSHGGTEAELRVFNFLKHTVYKSSQCPIAEASVGMSTDVQPVLHFVAAME